MNWKKLFKYLILFVLFSIIIYYSSFLNVSAANYSAWYDNIIDANLPVNFRMFSISSGGNASEITTQNGETTFNLSNTSNKPNYLTMNYFYNSTPVNFGNGNGIGFLFPVDIFLKQGSYYSLTLYFGTTSKLTNPSPFTNNRCDLTTNNTNYNNAVNNKGYCYYQLHYKQYKFIVTHNSPDVPFQHQYALTYMFSSRSANDTYIFLPLTDTVATSNQFYILGYEISFVGEDQTAVMSEIEELKEEEQQTQQVIEEQTEQQQQNHEEMMGTITDETSPDTSGLGNAAGWLPAGPVDSLLNLPITFFTTLLGKLDATCSPIVVELPFVEEDLTLPCLSTLFSQLTGFNTFWNSFGLIAGVWCLYKYFIALYKWVEHALSFDEKESLGKWGGV